MNKRSSEREMSADQAVSQPIRSAFAVQYWRTANVSVDPSLVDERRRRNAKAAAGDKYKTKARFNVVDHHAPALTSTCGSTGVGTTQIFTTLAEEMVNQPVFYLGVPTVPYDPLTRNARSTAVVIGGVVTVMNNSSEAVAPGEPVYVYTKPAVKRHGDMVYHPRVTVGFSDQVSAIFGPDDKSGDGVHVGIAMNYSMPGQRIQLNMTAPPAPYV